MRCLSSAFKHGVTEPDIHHGIEHSFVVDEVGEDPSRFLILGPDASGNFLEIVVEDRPDGPVVIHAMPMRSGYETLLEKGHFEE